MKFPKTQIVGQGGLLTVNDQDLQSWLDKGYRLRSEVEAELADNPTSSEGTPFKNQHKGETIVILGEGPSLAKIDFSLLEGYTTIGVNSIDTFFEPDYVVFLDDLSVRRVKKRQSAKSRTIQFFGSSIQRAGGYTFSRYAQLTGEGMLSNNYSRGLFWSCTSMFPAINLAYIFGASKIVLLGLDLHNGAHSYTEEGESYPEEFPSSKFISKDFERLAEFCKEYKLEIVNANPDSAIRSLPFANLKDVLRNGKER